MTIAKKRPFKAYPKLVKVGGKTVRVNTEAEEAKELGVSVEDVIAKNAILKKSPKEILEEAEEKLAEARRLNEETKALASPKAPASLDEIQDGDKDGLLAFAKAQFNVDLSSRKGFATLLEEVKQLQAQNA